LKKNLYNVTIISINTTHSNPCTRCGKERIISKRYEEQMYNYPGATKVVHIEKICPDPDCQRKVEAELKEQQQKKDNIRKKSQERALARRAQKDYLTNTT
jgi:hypothetical protein